VDFLPVTGRSYFYADFFCNECQDHKKMTVSGFWDGEATWKIRFAAPEAGLWSFTTYSRDPGLNNKKGKILVSEWSEMEKETNPLRRGFIDINKHPARAGRYFTYSDGTPFLWIGDTWWNWTKKDIHMESFKNLVDVRSEQGFTVGQLFFAGNGWGRISSMLDDSFTFPDLDHIRKVEEMIRYANSKGMVVWIHPWWAREYMDQKIGEEKIRRWWKYVIHRLQAYQVIWVLAGEYNMYNYGNLGLGFWKDLGEMVDAEDPYNRILSVHPTPPGWEGGKDALQWSSAEVLHDERWLSYNQSQPGHGKWRNELIPWIVQNAYKKEPAKPVVITEPWYEFIEGNPTALDIRLGIWGAFLSGAAGHSYGGGHTWIAHLPESPVGIGAWPMDTSFNTHTLKYPGARSMSFMGTFLKSISWWKLEPAPELVLENASSFCSADHGKEYLVYLRYGGSFRLDLRLAESSGFNVEWIDLSTGIIRKDGQIMGGKIITLSPPEDYPGSLQYKDWLVHVY
jgi:hypothetical protein